MTLLALRGEEPPGHAAVVVRGRLNSLSAALVTRRAGRNLEAFGFLGLSVFLAVDLRLAQLCGEVPELARYGEVRRLSTVIRFAPLLHTAPPSPSLSLSPSPASPVVLAEKPMLIGDQAFTTGAIARTTFEAVQPAAQIELGQRDGAGCDASHFTPAEQAGQIVPDQFWFEHATCFNVKDRGLVVISSCGHAGILNTVKAAQAASGVERVHALIGGFHLAPAQEPYVVQVVDALKAINPDYLVPMHCSGRTFTRLADAAMPGKVLPPSTGTRFVFGAI